MTDIRRELVDAIKRQMIADLNVEMSQEEREERLYVAAISALTPEEDSMPSEMLAKYLAAASEIALRELEH